MKALIKYAYQHNQQGYYDTSGVYRTGTSSCSAYAETKDDNGLLMTFTGHGSTYDQAKETALAQAKSFYANRVSPDPEIVDI